MLSQLSKCFKNVWKFHPTAAGRNAQRREERKKYDIGGVGIRRRIKEIFRNYRGWNGGKKNENDNWLKKNRCENTESPVVKCENIVKRKKVFFQKKNEKQNKGWAKKIEK